MAFNPLEEQIVKFQQRYLQGNEKELDLPELGYQRLKDLVDELGYRIVHEGEFPSKNNYVRHNTMHARVRKDTTIDVFVEFDPNQKPGFMYVHLEDLREYEE